MLLLLLHTVVRGRGESRSWSLLRDMGEITALYPLRFSFDEIWQEDVLVLNFKPLIVPVTVLYEVFSPFLDYRISDNSYSSKAYLTICASI